jgi:hypothetical protein
MKRVAIDVKMRESNRKRRWKSYELVVSQVQNSQLIAQRKIVRRCEIAVVKVE